MNELDALLKELNDPRSSYTPSALMNNQNMMGSPMFNNMNNMRFQQEPSPDQSPMKSNETKYGNESISTNDVSKS